MKKKDFIQKAILPFFVGNLCIGLSGCNNGNSITEDNFHDLEAGFKNPSSAYRTAPLAVWNSVVTNAEVERTMQELKDAGFGGLFVHPRPGLITEYLSDEWTSLFRHAVDYGKANDMNVWIYDENSYPSGFAGGHVPAEMPESYNQGQGLVLTKVTSLPEKLDEYYLVLKKENEKWHDITNSVGQYKKEKGDYYLYKKTYYAKSDWNGGYSYVDLMVKGVTEKFIDVTMKKYEKVAKDEFGKVIPGVFSDEPNIGSPGGLRWTPDLFSAFQEKWGYDLKSYLPLLQEETGNWKQVRHNYLSTLLQLFIDRWSKPYHKYCEENNLKWTGHYWEHGWPLMSEGPDNMAMYAWHQQPAIDMLFNQFDEESPMAQFGNVRAVKELRSVANQMGYTRTLSETYGGGGWEETFKDFKRLGDWQYVLGINFMNQHLAHMTLTGARKYDYPSVFTYHSPWWSDYKTLNDYNGRMSYVLSKGQQKNDILVIEPTSTVWCYYSHVQSNPKYLEIGKTFQAFVTNLEKHQVEYDLGCENIIKDHGSVANGKFIIGKAAYSTVVLPPMMETLDQPTVTLLKQFVKEGGKLICYSKPYKIDGSEAVDMKSLLASASVIDLSSDADYQKGVHMLLDQLDCKFTFNGGDLYHHRRLFKDGELLLLVNSSMDEAVNGSVSLKGKSVIKMDAMNGELYTYPSVANKESRTADFHIEPAGSVLLYFADNSIDSYAKEPQKAGNQKLVADTDLTIKRLRDNVLNIDFCDLNINGKITPNLYFEVASNIPYKNVGFKNGNPWNSAVQYKRSILERDTFTTGGFSTIYKFQVNDKFDYSSIKLVSERPELFTVKINGKEVKPNPGEWWLDRSFGVYSIGKNVVKGLNKVELSISKMSIFAEIQPVYILGDFSVKPENKAWSISAPVEKLSLGSWKEQKQPFYSWDVSYSKEYNIEDMNKNYAVQLNQWNGTVSEVYINGRKAGIIATNPYRLDVTPYLKEGKNSVDIHVIGSHKNLLGPFYKNASLGLIRPWQWKDIKEQLPGNEYQMLDYGLMEDFDLVY